MSSKKSRIVVNQFLQKKYPKDKAVKYESFIYEKCKDSYANLSYEKLGELVNAKDEKERLDILKDDGSMWDSCVYKNHKERYINSIDKSQQRPKPVKGLYLCKNKDCKSDEFYIWSAQTRSADEGMTHYRQCYKCGKRNKE